MESELRYTSRTQATRAARPEDAAMEQHGGPPPPPPPRYIMTNKNYMSFITLFFVLAPQYGWERVAYDCFVHHEYTLTIYNYGKLMQKYK